MTIVWRACETAAERPQHVVKRVADVEAFRRAKAFGDPEQPEEAHGMVDAERAGVAHHRVDGVAVGLELSRHEPRRRERREPPVLAVGVEIVGRRADPRARDDQARSDQVAEPSGATPTARSR